MSIVRFVPLHDCSRFLFGQFSVAIGSMRPELTATSACTPETGGGGYNRSSSSAKQKPRGGLKAQTFNVRVETFIFVAFQTNRSFKNKENPLFCSQRGRAARS